MAGRPGRRTDKRAALLPVLLLLGCATPAGGGLVPGKAGLDEVIAALGPPSLRWDAPDGAVQLAYPDGPRGVHTFMVHLDADQKLLRIENALVPQVFAALAPGMDAEAVLRRLGPPVPQWTAYFERRDELVWEWRYCDDWNQYARFHALFDGTSGKLRSTLSLTESQIGACGGRPGAASCWCAR